MKVLDVFSGTCSATKPFVDRGHDCRSVELNPDFIMESYPVHYPTSVQLFALKCDEVLQDWKPDFVWLSPPCDVYTMAGGEQSRLRWRHLPKENYHSFFGPRLPRNRSAGQGVSNVLSALHIIKKLRPQSWILENPQGGLQTMGFMQAPIINRLSGEREVDVCTVTYCQYGDDRMKPTCLTGKFPVNWYPRSRCYNGMSCHPSAPRGARTGTQGLSNSRERSRIPYALGEEICLALEKEA